MRIVVTGSNGFVGQYLCDYLEFRGHEVVRIVRGNKNKKSGNFVSLSSFSSPVELRSVLKRASAVIYLAGLAHMPEKFIDIHQARKINVTYPVNFAQEAKRMGIPRFVYISSVKVFILLCACEQRAYKHQSLVANILGTGSH